MGDPLLKAASPAGRSRDSLFGLTLVAATFVICLIRLGGFVQENAVNLMFNDQWGYLYPIYRGQGAWACFNSQQGSWREGLGGLIDWYLYNATGWDVRTEAWAAVVVVALTTIFAISLAVRLRGHLSWSDAGFSLLLLSPIHWETMIFTPTLSHSILPALLTVLVAYGWSLTNPVARVLMVGVFGAVDIFTGNGNCGAPVVIGLGLLLWLRPGKEHAKGERRQTGMILLCLGGAMAAFAHGYRWEPGAPGWRFPVPNWWDYPRFCALMFTSLLGIRAISPTTVAIGAVLLGLVLAVFIDAGAKIWRREATARAKAAWILTGTSLTFAALTAFGRLPMNIQAAFMWRYMTLMTLGLCGLAIAAEGWASSRSRAVQRCIAIGWIALAGMIWSNFLPEQYGATVAKGKRIWIASYLRTRDLHTANKESDFYVFFPAPDAPFVAEWLHWLEQRHLSFFRDSKNNRRLQEGPPGSAR